MTNEEAIKILSKERKNICRDKCNYNCRLFESRDEWCDLEMALDMAIKALDSKDEIISRIKQVRDNDKNVGEYPYNRCIEIIKEVMG